MALALADRGLAVATEACIPVTFRGRPVGDYRADIIAEGRLIIEVRAVEPLAPIHRAQIINYLRATSIEVGLLVSFGSNFACERFLFTNERHTSARPPH